MKLLSALIALLFTDCGGGPNVTYSSSYSDFDIEVRYGEPRYGVERLEYRGAAETFWTDASVDGPGGKVRCAEFFRVVACVVFDPVDGEHVSPDRSIIPDRSIVRVARDSDDRWAFYYTPENFSYSCSYTIWNSRQGIEEFGRADCETFERLELNWRLRRPPSLFLQ